MKKPVDFKITYGPTGAVVNAVGPIAKEALAALLTHDPRLKTANADEALMDPILARGFALQWKDAKFNVKEIR